MKTAAPTSLLILLAVLLAAAGASANEIYKWTDEDGNVHFGDRPLGDDPGSMEIVDVDSRRTDPETVSASVGAFNERRAARAEANEERAEAEQEAAEAAAEAKAQAERCARYRSQLETYVTARRLYKVDDNGERSYLDEDQMQAARADLQEKIQSNCTG